MEVPVAVGAVRGCERRMNDGIWAVYYYILFMCLMVMWKPNENASAYAYHNELATDIREDVGYHRGSNV